MSVSTLCQVCESAVANHACDQCGAAVCDDHYDRSMALCASCASQAGGGVAGIDDVGPGGPDGWT